MQRVIEIDVGALPGPSAVRNGPWSDPEPAIERIGSFGGSALAAAITWRAARSGAAPLAITVGECVRAGVPTAARASIASLSPLSGGYTEGLVGGSFARRLATVCDALVLRGRARELGVLVLDARGTARFVSARELGALDVQVLGRSIRERFPDTAALLVGPAGRAGVPFASIATQDEPPSFVGRGGLGAVFGALGLVALVVEAPEVAADVGAGARALRELCARSPRLRARSEGGTLEIAPAGAARGDDGAPRWSGPANAARDERKGCSGCPTPCGFVFERAGALQGAHYGALAAFGAALGVNRLEDALALLACCDAAGFDAKEAGAALTVLDLARARGLAPGPRLAGDFEALVRALESVATRSGEGALLARGAAELAGMLGLEDETPIARGQAVRSERALASRLGVVVSPRGGDPMRTLAFLAGDTPSYAVLERLLAPWPVAQGAADPLDPRGKGLLVWWSENLANALDTSGFCAFSGAGLLADGVATLDELAELVLPAALRGAKDPGRALLALGASVALLQHAIAAGTEDAPTPRALVPSALARELFAAGGPFDDYSARRGLDAQGRVLRAAWDVLGTSNLLDRPGLDRPGIDHHREDSPARASVPRAGPGELVIRAHGPLERFLGASLLQPIPAPVSVSALLRELTAAVPRARRFLVADGRPVPVVLRDGRRLAEDELVFAGDVLDLVVTLSGG